MCSAARLTVSAPTESPRVQIEHGEIVRGRLADHDFVRGQADTAICSDLVLVRPEPGHLVIGLLQIAQGGRSDLGLVDRILHRLQTQRAPQVGVEVPGAIARGDDVRVGRTGMRIDMDATAAGESRRTGEVVVGDDADPGDHEIGVDHGTIATAQAQCGAGLRDFVERRGDRSSTP